MKEHQNIKISVIIPIYQVEPYLRQCVDSVLAQTYQNLEIILVDDGSTDGSGKICDEYAEKDSRVIAVHKQNEGVASARNTGIEYATGKALSFADGDDFMEPEMIECLYKRMLETDAELVFCNFQYVDETGKKMQDGEMKKNHPFRESVWNKEMFWEQVRKIETPAFAVPWNKLYRRDLFTILRYPIGKVHEDEFVLEQIISRCNCIATVSKSLYNYRRRKGSITSDRLSPDKMDKLEAYLDRCECFRQKRNYKMLQKTVFDMIDLVEWFAYESELAGKPLPDRYVQLKQQIIEFTRRPVSIVSPIYWGVVLSYQWGIFPYRALRNIYWKFANARKNMSNWMRKRNT